MSFKVKKLKTLLGFNESSSVSNPSWKCLYSLQIDTHWHKSRRILFMVFLNFEHLTITIIFDRLYYYGCKMIFEHCPKIMSECPKNNYYRANYILIFSSFINSLTSVCVSLSLSGFITVLKRYINFKPVSIWVYTMLCNWLYGFQNYRDYFSHKLSSEKRKLLTIFISYEISVWMHNYDIYIVLSRMVL